MEVSALSALRHSSISHYKFYRSDYHYYRLQHRPWARSSAPLRSSRRFSRHSRCAKCSEGQGCSRVIHKSTQRSGVAEVWELDLVSYASVQIFAARVIGELEVLHVVVENAGILYRGFLMSEEDERKITVNVVSTIMLGILLLPKPHETASKTGTKTVLKFTGLGCIFYQSLRNARRHACSRSWPTRRALK
jgi:hypothetical protein